MGSSDGCVRVWDARSGGELLRLTLPPLGGAPCCVWAVLCLPDGTLVSGDAAGRTCVWEGRHGGLLHAFALHAADVLCLAATPQGDKLFAAGVDAHVQLLARTAGGGWAAAASKRPHARDIRALCLLAPAATGAALLSAGADGAVVAHAADGFAREHGVRVVRAQPQPQPCAAAAAPLLLVTHPQRLDVWRLGAARAPPPGAPVRPPGGSCSLELACAPRCLLSIAVRCDRHLLCGALSADGTRAAASDALRPRLYALALAPGGGPGGGPRAGGPASRARRLPLCASLPCALFAAFTPAWLVLGSPAGAVHLVDPTRGGAPVRAFKPHHTACGPRPAPQPTAVAVPPLSGLAASWDGEWVAVSVWCPGGGLTSTARGSCVVLLSLDAHRRAAALPLPQEEGGGGGGAAACCALAWAPHGHGAALLALTAAKRVLLCDTATGLAPAWAEAQQGAGAALSRRASAMPGHPLSLSCDPERGLCAVLLHTQLALCHVDATRPTSEAGVGGGAGAQPPKRRRDPGGADAQPAGPANGRVLALANPCLLAAYVRPGTVLLVEQPPQAQQDAGALLRHTFGK